MSNQLNLMEVIYSFEEAGSEILAGSIARYLKSKDMNISVCATHTGIGPLSQILQAEHINCYAMECETKSWLGKRYALYKLFKRKNIDVLHIHHMSIFILCYWPAKLAGVRKIIVTEHTHYDIDINKKLYGLCKKYVQRADFVTVIHHELGKYFNDNFRVPDDKLKVIPNGVDTLKFSPNEKFDKPNFSSETNNPIILGCVARFHPDKDHKNLIEAVRIAVSNSHHAIHLLLIGDGLLRQDLEKQVKDCNLVKNVTFMGARSDVADLYHELDIFVLPSKTEGVPLVLLEALSSGIPCIATAVGGIPELLNNTSGICVEKQNSIDLANAIVSLVDNEEMRKKMSSQGRTNVLKYYDQDLVFNQYAALFCN